MHAALVDITVAKLKERPFDSDAPFAPFSAEWLEDTVLALVRQRDDLQSKLDDLVRPR